jgi:hypothetical protein
MALDEASNSWMPSQSQNLLRLHPETGLPDFSWHNIPKLGKYAK